MFVSKAGLESGAVESYALKKRIEVVKHCRNIGKRDMKFNATMPIMEIDPESMVSIPRFPRRRVSKTSDDANKKLPPTQSVVADGMECKAEPAKSLPLTQQYFIY